MTSRPDGLGVEVTIPNFPSCGSGFSAYDAALDVADKSCDRWGIAINNSAGTEPLVVRLGVSSLLFLCFCLFVFFLIFVL